MHSSDLINPDQPPFWKFAGNERFHWHEHNLKQVYDLEWRHLSGSHGNLGTRDDIDFELAFIADMKTAVGAAIGARPFTDFVDPNAKAHTAFLANWNMPSPTTSPTPCDPSTAPCKATRTASSPTPRWSPGPSSSTADRGTSMVDQQTGTREITAAAVREHAAGCGRPPTSRTPSRPSA